MNLRALTIRQPWAGAIAHLGKTVENRSWATGYRGPIAIHAGAGVGARWEFDSALESIIDRGRTLAEATSAAAPRSAIVAVANLVGVCNDSLPGRQSTLACDCGVWAVNMQRHLRLADVRALPEPVPCKGALGFWRLPDDVDAAVRAQLKERAA